MNVNIDFQSTPVVDAVNEILVNSAKLKASDIHFDPTENGLKVRIRIDGILKTYLYDCTTGARDSTKSTGNGFKSSYGSVTSIDLSNLVVIFPKSDIITIYDTQKKLGNK